MAATIIALDKALLLQIDDPDRDDLAGVKVWASKTSGFTPSTDNLKYSGNSLVVLLSNLDEGVLWYIKYAYISTIDLSDYDFSSEISGTPIDPSGSYTPTLTNVTNVLASTAYHNYYSRTASLITVSGRVDIDATTANVATEITMSLPVPSDFTQEHQCSGTIASSKGDAGVISGATGGTSDVARIRVQPSDNGNTGYFFIFQYLVAT